MTYEVPSRRRGVLVLRAEVTWVQGRARCVITQVLTGGRTTTSARHTRPSA
jgi:hypothetical protein